MFNCNNILCFRENYHQFWILVTFQQLRSVDDDNFNSEDDGDNFVVVVVDDNYDHDIIKSLSVHLYISRNS